MTLVKTVPLGAKFPYVQLDVRSPAEREIHLAAGISDARYFQLVERYGVEADSPASAGLEAPPASAQRPEEAVRAHLSAAGISPARQAELARRYPGCSSSNPKAA